MSKIEDALKQAQIARRSRGSQPMPAAGRQLARTQPTQIVGLESRGHAREEIACMVDSEVIGGHELAENKIIFPDMRDNRVVDTFRDLRTKLIQKGGSGNMVLLVTSVSAGNGGTFVARNLGVSFSFDESKTALLVDCNLRHPSPIRKGAVEMSHGLTDYLESEDMPVEKIIYPIGIPRLRVIPPGARREIPTEYFTSMKMRRLLEALKQRYSERYVILDAPAITESADTRILTELADYVLLVVPYGKVTKSQIIAAARAIGAQKLAGVIFNNQPRALNLSGDVLPWREYMQGFSRLTRFLRRRSGGVKG